MPLRDLPGPVFYVAAALVGLAWSAVATAALRRLPRGLPLLRPGPTCPRCEAKLGGLDLVPIVSFLVGRGRARCCGARLDLSPLLLELSCVAAAIGLVPVTLRSLEPWSPLHRAAFVYLASAALAHALLVAAFIDARHAYLPDAITLGGALLGVCTAGLRGQDLHASLVGACVGFFVTALPFVYGPRMFGARPGLGLGDAKLMILAGAWLGARGALVALGLGAVQGLLAFGIARAVGRKILVPEEVRDEVGGQPALPFGPFLVLGVLERLFLGPALDAFAGVGWPPW